MRLADNEPRQRFVNEQKIMDKVRQLIKKVQKYPKLVNTLYYTILARNISWLRTVRFFPNILTWMICERVEERVAGTWDNESLLVLFSPFCLLSTILLQCLVMMLLPQPNSSVDKENFKNRLCWSHDIILRVQRLLTLEMQIASSFTSVNPNYKITNNSPFDFFGTTVKKLSRMPCLFAAISKQVKHVRWVHMECHANVT